LASAGGGGLREVFSADGMKAMLSQSAAVLPERPVRPGDTWQGMTETKSPVGTLVMQLDYTYRGAEQRAARSVERIDIAVTMRIADATKENGLEVSVTDQESQGTMYFDAAAGRFVESRLRQRMTLATKMGETSQEQKLKTDMSIQFQTVPMQARSDSSTITPISAHVSDKSTR
ncbi:MAG TPA: DUF6263 family protein, partial [Pirellulaceae bacterium]